MLKETDLKKFFKNQTELACLLAGGVATRATRIKAHRIWRGISIPNQNELVLIALATKGVLDANYFFNIKARRKS